MHLAENCAARRLFPGEQGPELVEITESGNFLKISCLNGNMSRPDQIRNFVTEWFDLNRDLKPFYSLMQKDPELSDLIRRFKGFRLVGIPDLFEALVWCVLGQQINLSFAYKLKRRLVERYGRPFEWDSRTYFLFPDPAALAAADINDLRAMQLTNNKAGYIKGLAQEFVNGSISKQHLLEMKSEDLMLEHLMALRGIGEWSANYALMKSLRAMDRVPYGDAGINNALLRLKGIPKKNNRPAVAALFSRFQGWKTYLVYYLWRSNTADLVA